MLEHNFSSRLCLAHHGPRAYRARPRWADEMKEELEFMKLACCSLGLFYNVSEAEFMQ